MIELTDTHCHIQSIKNISGEKVTFELWAKAKGLTLEQVVNRAKQNSVTRLIAVGCNLEDSRLAIKTASSYNNVWATIGIHPHEAKLYAKDKEKRQQFAALATQPKVIAIGEYGLDYYYSHSDPEDQKEILEFQIQLAIQHNLPVIFHIREAFKDYWPILKKYTGVSGVLHSFTDNQANLEVALKQQLYIGVNGIATFTKDARQTEVYKSIPDENLLLETDSPFLTPVPLRGSINEPKNVRLVAEYLADLRSQSLEQLAGQTTENARRLFKL
ncbi:MAG: TatD family hydrolase [Candidatus Saccharimonadales bacterium]